MCGFAPNRFIQRGFRTKCPRKEQKSKVRPDGGGMNADNLQTFSLYPGVPSLAQGHKLSLHHTRALERSAVLHWILMNVYHQEENDCKPTVMVSMTQDSARGLTSSGQLNPPAIAHQSRCTDKSTDFGEFSLLAEDLGLTDGWYFFKKN